jgi:RAB protein geranylgeranyltransferase component A
MPHDAIQSVEWHSKNPNVAEVNNGVVRLKNQGTAAIVVVTHNGVFKDSCLIKVSEKGFNSSPTLMDSLLGEWTACDENLQILPYTEILECLEVVDITPEGYKTISYRGVNRSDIDGFIDGVLTMDEKNRVFRVVQWNVAIKVQVLEITKNTLKVLDVYTGNRLNFIRTK